MGIEVKTLSVGELGTNCYLVFDKKSGTLYVIDPGGNAEYIVAAAKKFDFSCAVILLTHAHVDHISAVRQVAEQLKADSIYLNPADLEIYNSPENAIEPIIPAAKDLPLTTGELQDGNFEIISLPGHTPGGSGFLFRESRQLFSGDTIFAGSIGRTDFPGGSYSTMMETLKNRILPLDDDIEIHPGHGAPSSIGIERKTNPYLQDL